MTKVSVIVPIYKVEKYLVQCIDSIVNQTLKDIEIILVDEGDIDACRFIIDHYEQTDNRVKTIHEKNGGYGASVNKGFDIATGEYISIIESDDFIEPTMLEEMYEYAKKLDADVVKTPFYVYEEAKKGKPEKKEPVDYTEEMEYMAPKDKLYSATDYPRIMGIHASLWSAIYKTSYLKENNIKFITAKGGAYVDVGFRIDTLINTNKIAWLNKCFYNYRTTNEDSTTNNYNLDAMIERWKEAHEKFLSCMDIYEKVGPELVWDEYVNTAGYLFNYSYKVTQKQLDKIKEIYQYIPDSVINNAPRLTKHEKKVMFEIKHKNMKIGHYSNKSVANEWWSSTLNLRANSIKINLLKKMKHKIFRITLTLGGLYKIDFSIGKVWD